MLADDHTDAEVARMLTAATGRPVTAKAVDSARRKAGINKSEHVSTTRAATMNAVWTEEEEGLVRSLAATLSDEELARRVSAVRGVEVTRWALAKKRQSMGLIKAKGRGVCELVKPK